MAMFLTSDELVELTGRRRANAQAIALTMMGINFKRRPDGTLVVLRAHVEQLLGDDPARPPVRRKTVPDFSKVS